jgi:hypothetical protein
MLIAQIFSQIFLQMALNLNEKKTSSNLCFVYEIEKSCNSNHQYTFSLTNYKLLLNLYSILWA